jgi:hypothetical protein
MGIMVAIMVDILGATMVDIRVKEIMAVDIRVKEIMAVDTNVKTLPVDIGDSRV